MATMQVPTYEELKEALSKANYHLDFERRKTDHLMKSIADLQRDLCRPHGIIHNDIENASDPRRNVGQSTVGYSIAFDVICVLVGILIGHILCK